GCRRSVKKLWNHLFQFHKSKGNYTDSQLAAFLTEGKRGVQPAGLPTPPDSPLDGGEPSQKLCPVPGC
ncbi:hypothetical protein GBAR_LOCUS26761, partial [Geodia barretti]